MHIRRISTSFALGLFALLGVSACETGQNWGPVDSSYKGETRVRAKGNWRNSLNAKAVNRIEYRDTSNDGNTVYVKTEIRWWKWNNHQTTPAMAWVSGGTKSTEETSSRTFKIGWVSWSLDADGSRARAAPQACAQMSWPVPDSCGSGGVPTFDY